MAESISQATMDYLQQRYPGLTLPSTVTVSGGEASAVPNPYLTSAMDAFRNLTQGVTAPRPQPTSYQQVKARTDATSRQLGGVYGTIPGLYQDLGKFYEGRTQETRDTLKDYGQGYQADMEERAAQMRDRILGLRGGLSGSYMAGVAADLERKNIERQNLSLADTLARTKLDYIGKATAEEGQIKALLPTAVTNTAESQANLGYSLAQMNEADAARAARLASGVGGYQRPGGINIQAHI